LVHGRELEHGVPDVLMSQSATRRQDQLSLFESDAALMARIRALPKVDLHRHLTGSLSADMAVKLGAAHNIELPSYIASELHQVLFSHSGIETHADYFSPWQILNKLYKTPASTQDLVWQVIEAASADNVAYMELRLGPRGFLGDADYSFEEFTQCVAQVVSRANATLTTQTRCVLGIPRHVFIKVPETTRKKMLAKIIYTIREYPECFVGVDLNGDELAAPSSAFSSFFHLARDAGLGITVHAGEIGSDAADVAYAVEALSATRIGHGLAAALDTRTLTMLGERKATMELCPTSNVLLGVVDSVSGMPIRRLQQFGVPYAICTDNPARCQTSLSEELFKVAKAFSCTFDDICQMVRLSVQVSFADDAAKSRLRQLLPN